MTTEQITAAISGVSFSIGYAILKINLWDIDSFLDILFLLIKTSVIGVLGGFCGLLGKEIFNKLKKKFNK